MLSNNLTNFYPVWYIINDFLIIPINITGIIVAILFIYTVIRLEHPSYSISDLIACKTCLAIGSMTCSIFLNNCYTLASDFRGVGYCISRGTLSNILFIIMYTSLCLKAFNRLHCIVYGIRSISRSYQTLRILIFIQWLFILILILPILITDGISSDGNSHLCLVITRKVWQFIFLMIIYYISILFILSAYLYILYYVVHLSLLERYRRKRQLALLRRILILLFMLILPGIFYFILIIFWIIVGSIPGYLMKITTLIESIAHTGLVMTIFLSNTRVRRQFYKPKKDLPRIQQENANFILLKPPLKKVTIIQSSFTIERIVVVH